MMETLACRDAISVARQFGLQGIYLETNCLELVQLWEKTQRSTIGPILVLEEIDDIWLAFQDFLFTYTK